MEIPIPCIPVEPPSSASPDRRRPSGAFPSSVLRSPHVENPGSVLSRAGLLCVLCVLCVGYPGSVTTLAADVPPRPFRIQVVDESTGRGIPLVELETVNHIRYVTDSNGIVAFDEPGLFGRKVFFHISSHGYEVKKDGFGYRGLALEITPGGSARVVIRRRNIAERLYRVTGAGIYRDSVLTGDRVPIREPLLNGQVLGQDSVVNAVYRGKVYWFWGDTNRPDYPLGNFHAPGATSDLPGQGGLDPSVGVDLAYFLDDHGFARPTAPIPGDGPTWLSGLVVLRDREGKERMFASYAKIRQRLEVYQQGLAEFRPETNRFEKVAQFPDLASVPMDFPTGHTFLHRDRGVEYVYYANPYPLIRVPADPEKLGDPSAFEAYTCLKPGTTRSQAQLDHGRDGTLHYSWKRNTQVLPQDTQDKLIAAGRLKAREALLNLRDVETGRTVQAHGGSVYWNPHRGRWVMIAVESYGTTSYLGEVWYAEADAPLGPWAYARKVVTHDRYSFYNPKQHPMFDRDGGRVIFFEGTFTTTFSGNDHPTPRYDYNQVMYRLDLADPRLALPVAVYETPGEKGSTRLATRSGRREPVEDPPTRVAFFAPDRPGLAALPVYEDTDHSGGRVLRIGADPRSSGGQAPSFYIRPDVPGAPNDGTVRFYEHRDKNGGRVTYSVDSTARNGRPAGEGRVLGRVWPNPAPAVRW